MAKDEKQAALEAALKKIEKNFGKGAVMRMGEKVDTQISTVPSGSLALDAALGVGGYPRGRRSGAARRPTSTRKTPWTRLTLKPWAWTSTN